MKNKTLRFGLNVLMTAVFSLVFVSVLYGQGVPGPPSFPSAPDAAPIDGGLGLLAAAGGAYAYKKLKARRAE